MKKVLLILLVTLLCSTAALAQDALGRLDSRVFVGLDFADRLAKARPFGAAPLPQPLISLNPPTVQFGVQTDYALLGPLFAGGSAAIYQNRDAIRSYQNEWELRSELALDVGAALPWDFKAFYTVRNALGRNFGNEHGAGVRYRMVDARFTKHRVPWQSDRWSLLLRVSVYRIGHGIPWD